MIIVSTDLCRTYQLLLYIVCFYNFHCHNNWRMKTLFPHTHGEVAVCTSHPVQDKTFNEGKSLHTGDFFKNVKGNISTLPEQANGLHDK